MHKMTTQELMASIAAAKNKPRIEVAPQVVEVAEAPAKVDGEYDFGDFAARAERASIKDERGSIVPAGAHLLSIVSSDKYLKGCAPIGGSPQGSGFPPTSECKQHALSHAPEQDVSSLCSPTQEDEQSDKGYADDDADLAGDDDDALSMTGLEYNPNFYQVKADLFDNEGEKKSTRWRAKLNIRAHPTTYQNESVNFMADFYNRPRDINKRIMDMGFAEHPWYGALKAQHEEWMALPGSWTIPPKIAILKELARDGNQTDSVPTAFGGALLAQPEGEEPILWVWFQAWRGQITLDLQFEAKKRTNLYRKGVMRDASRRHLDVETANSRPKFKLRKF